MRYLVTGGAGFIGQHLCRALLQAGHEVISLDVRENGLSWRNDPLHVRGDVRDHRIVGPLVKSVDGVFHLAAIVGFANVMARMRETIVTNTAGTECVLHHAHMCGVPVLLTSTSACYGRSTNTAPVREDQDGILGPTQRTSWAYAYAKAVDEALAFAYHQDGLPVCIARVFNTVGPGQSAEAGFVFPRFIEAAISGDPLIVHHPGTQARTFGHVADVARMLIALMNGIREQTNGQLVNVGGRERITIQELALRIVHTLDSKSPIVSADAPYGSGYDNVTDREPNLQKLKALTGLEPEHSLEDMILDTAGALI